MSNITKIIFILIALIATFLLLILYIVPNLSESIETSKAIETEREDNKALRERLGELLLEREEYNTLIAKNQIFLSELPSESDTIIFNDEICGIAKDANVNIDIEYADKVTSVKVKEKPEILIKGVTLALEGSYYDILRFIETLEKKMPRIVIIGDITLQSSGEDYESLSASITAEIYYYKI